MAEQKYTISDIIETYISGDWGNDEPTEDASCPVSCIRGADIVPIYNSEYNNIPLRYISEKSLSNRALKEGDIVIEKSGGSPTQSTGRVVYISKELLEEKQDIVCSNFCAAFRIKPEWDAKYVYYYLQHIYNAGVFFNFEGKTSGLKNLIMDTAFKSITIKKIAIETQRSIATILSTIESKMAVNRAINHYLEAMAKQLYDYWFVQFDFPDVNGKPYKSSGGKMVWNEKLKRDIPEYWEDSTLEQMCNMYQPQTISVSLLNEDGVYRVYGANGIVGRYDRFNHENSEIAMACRGNSCGTINRTMPYSWITGNAMVIQLKDDIIHNEYIKQALAYMNVAGSITGSGQPQLTRENLKSILCVQPSSMILYRFSQLIAPFVNYQIQIIDEIEKSISYRNKILPLLMTGQVSIKQLNNDLANG